ncbi:hypothetical protein HGRIS_011850 [Hohenbuehelia grisea]|uniref:Uncharacterized protein n=1 Tax=Hohenbuehelia grisea TaxID=104357 RepID=A0ABR3JXG0_9AGAR
MVSSLALADLDGYKALTAEDQKKVSKVWNDYSKKHSVTPSVSRSLKKTSSVIPSPPSRVKSVPPHVKSIKQGKGQERHGKQGVSSTQD